MSANIATVAEQTAVQTLQTMLPVILAGVAAGQAATSPQAATIAALAPVIISLIQSGTMGAPELTQYMTALSSSIQANTAAIDAEATARGVTVP